MATETSTTRYVPKSRPATCDASPRFNWAMAVLSTVLVGGFYLDLWAHAHGRTDNTFFAHWHAVLYSMLAAVGIFLSIAAWRTWHRGAPWWESLPAGYGLSLVGVALFAWAASPTSSGTSSSVSSSVSTPSSVQRTWCLLAPAF